MDLGKLPPSLAGLFTNDREYPELNRFYERQANSAVALIRLVRAERAWSLLKHNPNPSLRSYLVHRLGPLGVEPGLLIAKLDQESDVSSRRALIFSLGEVGEGRISTSEKVAWTTKLLDLYRNDPDPGIHGATDWLLRKRRCESQIQEIDRDLGKLPLPTLSMGKGAGSSKENFRK